MTEESVKNYKELIQERTNIVLDEKKEYLPTFWNSSILICDYTSMIIEYYTTCKPIIYLTYDHTIGYTDQMTAMLSGCYIVNNEFELVDTIERLHRGDDPLLEKRINVYKNILMGDTSISASDTMKKILIEDYNK